MLGRLLHITLNTFRDTQTPVFKTSENKIVHINVSCRYNDPGAFVKRWQTAGRAENNAANKLSSQIIIQTLSTRELSAFSKRINVLLRSFLQLRVWSRAGIILSMYCYVPKFKSHSSFTLQFAAIAVAAKNDFK